MKSQNQHKKVHAYEPDYAVAPGQTLQETIDTLGMDQRELAVRTGLSPKTINQIIQGSAPVTHETALRLEHVTNVPSRFWNNLEMNYRDQKAKLYEKNRLKDDLTWLRHIPTLELIKRKKIENQQDKASLLESVLGFFGVADVRAWRNLWLSSAVSFRKSPAFQAKPGAMATWLRLGEVEAMAIKCMPFDKNAFKDALNKIRRITITPPDVFIPRMTQICSSAGVAVVLVREIKGAPVCGAAQWLAPEKAMIQLSLRYKTNDQFWFSFFHEAGHIMKHGKKQQFIDMENWMTNSPEEQEANKFAADILIPPMCVKDLEKLKSRRAVISFAKVIGIAPGIVVGRLQHHGIIGYNELNNLKRRYQWSSE